MTCQIGKTTLPAFVVAVQGLDAPSKPQWYGARWPAKQRNDVRGSKNLLKLTEDVNSG